MSYEVKKIEDSSSKSINKGREVHKVGMVLKVRAQAYLQLIIQCKEGN